MKQMTLTNEGELKHSDYIQLPRINYEHLSKVLEVKHRNEIKTKYKTMNKKEIRISSIERRLERIEDMLSKEEPKEVKPKYSVKKEMAYYYIKRNEAVVIRTLEGELAERVCRLLNNE